MSRTLLRVLLAAVMMVPALPAMAVDDDPELSYTRLLQRVHLRLRGKPPSIEEYQAILDAPDDQAREAFINEAIDEGLNSQDFYDEVLNFGHEYLGVGNYISNANYPPWKNSIHMDPCPEGTKHVGRYGVMNYNESAGDSRFICDEYGGPCDKYGNCKHGFTCDGVPAPKAGYGNCQPIESCTEDSECGAAFLCSDEGQCEVILSEEAPWWDPSTTVQLIGWAGEGHTTAPNDPGKPDIDCGVITPNNKIGASYAVHPKDRSIKPRCGCGPNLIYCDRGVAYQSISNIPEGYPGLGRTYDGFENDPSGRHSSIFQEAGRLFAHIIVNDRSFDDLVLANYTVVNEALYHFYVRTARMTGRFQSLDDSMWFMDFGDPNEWQEVFVEDINPFYLKDRHTKHDPRVTTVPPPGIPSAGVLTTLGASGSFLRERPRAARWLENLTCRSFTPPPADIIFDPYVGDPATGGACVHCHLVLDPAAMFFKRFSLMGPGGINGQGIGGIEPYRWESKQPFKQLMEVAQARWAGQYAPDTVMTPASELDILFNPDARFIDFLPEGSTLFGVTGDGTIGPLGFGKIIVESGEFDRCTVQRFYERYAGLKLNPGTHKLYIDKLVQVFASKGKKIRPFIKWIFEQPRFRKGH